MILQPLNDDDATNMMLDLYYYRYNADLGFTEEDVKVLANMCSNRPGLIASLASLPYTIVSAFITESTILDTNGGINVNVLEFQTLLHQSLKKEEKMLAESLAIFCSDFSFLGFSCSGYMFSMKLAWCLSEKLFKKEVILILILLITIITQKLIL